MKLSKLYANFPDLFGPVIFHRGLCVVLAEIRLASNRAKDTHNLGKTILGRMIDFGLLAKRDPKFFLFKHLPQFEDFVFYLELELMDGSYVTVRRSVKEASKIGFKRHQDRNQDFTGVMSAGWDHWDIPFDRAKEILDGILDWRAMQPWNYRKGLGYLLRSQDDYRDVFQLGRDKSKHADWKPFLAHVLGFDSELLTGHYEKEAELEKIQATEKAIKEELGGSVEDISKIEGMLLLKQQTADKRQTTLDAFDFRGDDKDQTKSLVEEIDERIASLNSERYYLAKNRKKVVSSLEETQILFNPEDARVLFDQAGVYFGGQLKRDYEQLIAFNEAITQERRRYLEVERQEIDVRLKKVTSELAELGERRSRTLAFLTTNDVFAKYKQISSELVSIKTDIASLERQRGHLHRLQALRAEIRQLMEDRGKLQTKIEEDVEKQNSDVASLFSKIRLYFSEIVERVIDRKALLSVSPNKEGHLDFRAEILDESGNATSADMGHTYRKLLCIAFDFAVLRAHSANRFPRFVYHDGVLESLDDRKKENLLAVIREHADLGLQPILTLLNSDVPMRASNEPPVFDDEEIVLSLHDEDETGRLFRMPAW